VGVELREFFKEDRKALAGTIDMFRAPSVTQQINKKQKSSEIVSIFRNEEQLDMAR